MWCEICSKKTEYISKLTVPTYHKYPKRYFSDEIFYDVVNNTDEYFCSQCLLKIFSLMRVYSVTKNRLKINIKYRKNVI